MLFIKTFESYYKDKDRHFTISRKICINSIQDDILNLGSPSYPRGSKGICLTRFPGYGQAKVSDRLQLDTNKLIRAGFKPTPIAENSVLVYLIE
jgi:hypothetical protein